MVKDRERVTLELDKQLWELVGLIADLERVTPEVALWTLVAIGGSRWSNVEVSTPDQFFAEARRVLGVRG